MDSEEEIVQSKKRERICQVCGLRYNDVPAVSRRDRKLICPDCGTREALEDACIDINRQNEILEEIHRYAKKAKGSEVEGKG